MYCAVCILQHQMEVEGCVDVVTTARHLREQRPGILTSQVRKGGEGGEEGRSYEREIRKKPCGNSEKNLLRDDQEYLNLT